MASPNQPMFVEYEKCAKCLKQIKAPAVHGGGKHWHADCLKCDTCKTVIENEFRVRISVVKDKPCLVPYCVPCFEKQFLNQCVGCKDRIRDNQFVIVHNAYFHSACNKCATCQKVFVDRDNTSRLVGDKIYCQVHIPQRGP